MSLPSRLAFIDVESTGAHPVRDRITEIAILRVEDGEVVARWESLVAPGQPIPPLIEEVTGISDAMVADAPAFEALADTVAALLEGCVFVAHSARFDYGFIRNAFTRIGREFEAPVLCTVKLSRALYPEHHRHGLDALIERHGLVCSARHRAMGDVEVLWQFVRGLEAGFAPEVLARAAARAMKAPAQPPGLPEGLLEALPDAPGLYLFHAQPEPPPLGMRATRCSSSGARRACARGCASTSARARARGATPSWRRG
jgi:DNA polymerase-3 subunit epsilon